MTPKLQPKTLISSVTKAQKGDRDAYSQIVRQFQDLAVGYAYSILKNFSLAEEAAQEAFLEAYLKLNSLLEPAAFPCWLKKIVFKHCDREMRKKRPHSISLEQSNDLISTQPTPSAIAERQELKTVIHQAIELLPDKEREVIIMFYLGERSQQEISTFLEVPISTIKNRLFSARKKLKQNCHQMIEDYLSNQRPSQGDRFTQSIESMIKAAYSGDIATIQKLLNQDANLANVRDSNIHSTPLHYAAHRGYYDIVKLLLKTNTDVNVREDNYSKSTPLHWAATRGHLEVVRLLVENGAKLDLKDDWNNLTPLGWASIVRYDLNNCSTAENYREIQQYLLDCGAKLDIFSAIALERVDAIDSLIENNPEVLDRKLGLALDEWQPLHFAIARSQTEIARLLIEKGANLQAKTIFEVTPLCMALQTDNREIVNLLSDRQIPHDLSALLLTEQWLSAERAIAKRPNLIVENSLLLHYTIIQGLFSATSWLIEHGADLEVRNISQLNDYVVELTPLHLAIKQNQIQIAEFLLKSGANVNAKTKGELEITALHGAVARGNTDLVRLLLQYDADSNIRDNIGIGTALDWAKNFQQDTLIELLESNVGEG
jgi:RNA polymerase sigma factor (sigma-70 family)